MAAESASMVGKLSHLGGAWSQGPRSPGASVEGGRRSRRGPDFHKDTDMDTSFSTWRRALAAALAVVGLAAGTALAQPSAQPYVKSSLVQVDVYDRFDGVALPVYQKDGRHYIVGVPGHEVRGAHPQLHGRPRARRHERGWRQRDLRRHGFAGAIGLRARSVGVGRDRWMAQEHGAHRRVLLHRSRRLLRGADRPPAKRRRHRRRGLPGASEAHRVPRAGPARPDRRQRSRRTFTQIGTRRCSRVPAACSGRGRVVGCAR